MFNVRREIQEWRRIFDQKHPLGTLNDRELYCQLWEELFKAQCLIFGATYSKLQLRSFLCRAAAVLDRMIDELTGA